MSDSLFRLGIWIVRDGEWVWGDAVSQCDKGLLDPFGNNDIPVINPIGCHWRNCESRRHGRSIEANDSRNLTAW